METAVAAVVDWAAKVAARVALGASWVVGRAAAMETPAAMMAVKVAKVATAALVAVMAVGMAVAMGSAEPEVVMEMAAVSAELGATAVMAGSSSTGSGPCSPRRSS